MQALSQPEHAQSGGACRAELLIKWEGLGYDELSWEKAADLTEVDAKVAALKARQPIATQVGPSPVMAQFKATAECTDTWAPGSFESTDPVAIGEPLLASKILCQCKVCMP